MSASTQGASAPSVFHFNTHPVRVIIRNGEPWFALRDVCDVLSVDRTSRLLRDLDEKGLANCQSPTASGNQELTFINEPNLYRVTMNTPPQICSARWRAQPSKL